MDDRERRSAELRVGTQLAAKYELVRLLGVGGMGAVYEAVNLWTERRVAIKLMHADAAHDAEAAARFLREARAAARLEHPNIVQVLDAGQDASDGTLYIAVEYLAGQDLRGLLNARGVLPPREALEVLTPVMSALVAAHRQGVDHRDLKPENIFLAKAAAGGVTPKVIDFGIAKIVESAERTALTRTGAAMGTAAYMSPEQARGERSIDAQTDVWALGVILFETLAGQCPFDGDNFNEVMWRISTAPVPRLDAVAPSIPRPLADVVARALTRERPQRFRSVAQFLGALLDCETFLQEDWHRALSSSHRRARAADAFADDAPTRVWEAEELARERASPHAPDKASPRAVTTLGTAARTGAVEPEGRRVRRATVLGAAVVVVATPLAWLTAHALQARPPVMTPRAVVAPTVAAPFAIAVTTRPVTATIELDGRAVGIGAFAGELPRDGQSHTLHLDAPGYQPRELTFRDVAPPSLLELAPAAASPAAASMPSTGVSAPWPRAPVQATRVAPPASILREPLPSSSTLSVAPITARARLLPGATRTPSAPPVARPADAPSGGLHIRRAYQ